MVYRDYDSFRKIYPQHAKKRIESNEVVILLPYYETTNRARATFREAGVNIKAQESSGFLVIIDSYAVFLGFQQDDELFFRRLVSHAFVSRKSGIYIIADMGAFFLIDRVAVIALAG